MTRRLLSAILVLAMMLTFASFPAMAKATNPKRVKIMTIGDSITQGTVNQNAYRYSIYENLIQDGAVFQFIGPFTSQDFRVSSTNNLYNGHGGYGGAVIGRPEDYTWNGSKWITSSWSTTDPISNETVTYSGSTNSVHYRLFANTDGTRADTSVAYDASTDTTVYGQYVAEADIVTLLIGYNDFFSTTLGINQEAIERYEVIVDRIYHINPDVSLYVVGLHDIDSLKGHNSVEGTDEYNLKSFRGFNDLLEAFPEYYKAKHPDRKISFISLDAADVIRGVDTPRDDLHPNASGDDKLGDIIYEGIKDEILLLNENESDESYNPTRVTGISLDKTSATLKIGENLTVVSTVTPADAEVITTVFSSSNEAVATVDHYGRITAVGAGTATIYATALDSLRPDSAELKATCTVTVTNDSFTRADKDYVDVYVNRFLNAKDWTGNTGYVTVSSPAYKHPSSMPSSTITSEESVDLGKNFSMSFGAAVFGVEYKAIDESNRNNYYSTLTVGNYQLRVGINGKVVAFYNRGVLQAEKVFATPISKGDDDRYTLVKNGATVYVYRNNELLFTTTVDANDTASGKVELSCRGYNSNALRDVVLKRGADENVNLPEKLNVSSVEYESTNSGTQHGTLENIIDGEIDTAWGLTTWNDKTHSFKFDLGNTYDLSALRISWGGASANVVRSTSATVYVSTNGTSWDKIATAGDTSFVVNSSTPWSQDGYVDDISLSAPTSARYVRIVSTANGTNRGLGVREVEVYGYSAEPTEVSYTVKCVSGTETLSTTTATGYVGMSATVEAPAISGYTAVTTEQSVFFENSTAKTVIFEYVEGDYIPAEPEVIDVSEVISPTHTANGSNVLGRIIDGNTTDTYFQATTSITDANNPNFELIFDLGDSYNLTNVKYYAGLCYMTSATLYGSNTGYEATDWTEIGSITATGYGYPSYLASDKDLEHTGYYRYIKVKANTFSTKSSATPVVREFIFTGVAGTPGSETPDVPETPKEPEKIAIVDGKTNYEQLDTGHTVRQTYDGNTTGSYYQTKTAIPDAANPDFYLAYDLGKAYNLTHFTYHGGSCYIKAGTIYGSNTGMDADDWVELSTFSSTGLNWTTYIAVDTDLSHTGYYRYVKVAADTFNSAAKPAIREIVFTGVEGTPADEPDIPDEPETPSNDPKPIKPNTETATNIAVSGIGSNATDPLTDGDLTTYAQIIPGQTYFDGGNTGDAVEYVFDFGKKQAFAEFTVYWSLNRMTSGDVYVSNDGVNWGKAIYSTGTISYQTMDSVSNGSVRKATFTLPDGTIGRYFKLVVTGLFSSNQANVGCMFREIEFVGKDVDEKVISLGGSIRIPDAETNLPSGLRFGAKVVKANVAFEGEYKYSDDAELKFGMYLLPKDMLDGQTLTEYLANGVQQALDVPARRVYEQDDYSITFTAVLTGIPETAYDRDIVAVSYMLKGGEYTYFDEMIKSYAGVAAAARETTYSDTAINNATGEEKEELIEIAYQLDCIANGWDAEYDPTAARTVTKTFDFSGSLGSYWRNCPEQARAGGSYWENDMTSFDSEGNLVLSAKWDSSLNNGNGYLMTGAVRTMTTNYSSLYSAGYGYYEVRAKFPNAHKGAWGAFWQMAGDMGSNTANGAADGVEIDFIETIGNDKGKCQSALHWDGYSTNATGTGATYLNHNVYDGNWHTIGCERTAEGYKFYIDGRLMWVATADEVAPCSLDGYLKLTVEAAPWAVDNTSDYSVYSAYMSETYAEKTDIMVIDYVKVYED